jgi:hypothetical protein
MLRRLAGRHDLLASLLLLASSTLGCESPTHPGDSNLLAFGSMITGHLASGEVRRYELDVEAGQAFAVYVEATGGHVGLELRDPSARQIGLVILSPGAATASDGMADFPVAGGRYAIIVSTPQSDSGNFTLRPTLIDMAPEHVAQMIALGEVVSGERIDHRFDQDEFLVDIPVAQEAELYLSSDVGHYFAATVVRVGASATAFNDYIWPPVGWADLELGASGRFSLEAGRYRVRFSGDAGAAYNFQLRTVNPKPETAAELLTVGDTVAESIDYVGDVDDFVLRGTPGGEYEVFVSAGGAAPHRVEVLLLGLTQLAGPWASVAPGTPLLDSPTGRFTMPATGQMTVRVRDWQDRAGGLYRGPYRLVAVAIDRRPEGLSDVIVPSANVIASALDIYGDVDEYRFTLDTPKRLALRCAPTPAGGCSAYAAAVFRDDAPTQPVDLDTALPLLTGAYRLRVQSGNGNGAQNAMYRGPYQMVLAPVDTTPEDVPSAVTVGSTISETRAWPWDIDTFMLDVASSDTMWVHLTVSDSAGSRYSVGVTDLLTGRALGKRDPYDSPTDRRIDLAPGRYAVTVNGVIDGWAPGALGSYKLELHRATAAPEGRTAALALGDTVRGRFEYTGDIDDYVLTGAPWEMVNFTLIADSARYYADLEPIAVTAIDPVTGTVLGVTSTINYTVSGVPVEIPSGGTLKLRFCALPNCSSADNWTGPHTVVVNHVNGAPELRAAAFAVGDTVAESLENGLDVDEFTFDGTAGQVVDLVGLLAPTTPAGNAGLLLELLDRTSGERLALLPIRDADVRTMTAVLRGLVLPRTGSYLVRIRPETTDAPQYPAGPYRFVIAPH